jgi:hypothetical protein
MSLPEFQHVTVLLRAREVARWSTYAAAAALLWASPGTAQQVSSQVRLPSAGCGASAGVGGAPYFAVLVNGECADLSSNFQPTGRPGVWTGDVDVTVGGAHFDINATFDADPFITFGSTVTNLGAGPITYSFLFSVPIVPGFYNVATSTGGVSVTNGTGGTATVDNSAVYPTYISGYGTLGGVPTNLGVDIGTSPCTAGPGVPLTVTRVCDQGNASNVFADTFYDGLEALLTYTQTDVASVASWSGGVTLNFNAVPEPATVGLVAAGLFATAWATRRRRQAP